MLHRFNEQVDNNVTLNNQDAQMVSIPIPEGRGF